jgi:hypothetical protein
VNEEGVETGGLKVHVDEDRVGRLRVGIGGIVVSTAELTVGDVLLPLALNISVSLIVTKDNGERTTDPGVMLGSSSTLLICVPFHGFPGSNSGTRSVKAAELDCVVTGQESLLSG